MDALSNHSNTIMATSERPAPPSRTPSLLPAFEPLSSSPIGLPRTTKRKFDEHAADDSRQYYPTPVPTSSTGILPSSPNTRSTRPGLQRAVSSLSERAPLGAVPSIDLPANGEPVLMGRSSNSSDYQLSANRLISRVHVRAFYQSPTASRLQGEVVVECVGWNGAKIHYQGSITELAKGETFVSQKPGTPIMVDVQETRVQLVWPVSTACPAPLENRWPWAEDVSPSRGSSVAVERFASSPPPMLPRLRSPVSPSPRNQLNVIDTFDETFLADDMDSDGPVQVYEDNDSADDLPGSDTPKPLSIASPQLSKVSTPSKAPAEPKSSSLSEVEDLSEHDEENDPIVHSFGPFGENLLSRFESFTSSTSPDRPRAPLKAAFKSPARSPEKPTLRRANLSPIKNHVINQLAFSRVHSIPLSTIFTNLPADMRGGKKSANPALSNEELKELMDKIPCVGEIRREGKDAAGKPLEDEFYYVPEMDSDEHRRNAVNIAKPPLRATRKQHKVCLTICVLRKTRLTHALAILLEETPDLSRGPLFVSLFSGSTCVSVDLFIPVTFPLLHGEESYDSSFSHTRKVILLFLFLWRSTWMGINLMFRYKTLQRFFGKGKDGWDWARASCVFFDSKSDS